MERHFILKEKKMPKMKTKSGAKKRFKITGSGRVKFKQSNTRHRLLSRPNSMKRKARGMTIMSPADEQVVLTYMPYMRKKKKSSSAKKGDE
jgi:large subunit ribosomal protein L35